LFNAISAENLVHIVLSKFVVQKCERFFTSPE